MEEPSDDHIPVAAEAAAANLNYARRKVYELPTRGAFWRGAVELTVGLIALAFGAAIASTGVGVAWTSDIHFIVPIGVLAAGLILIWQAVGSIMQSISRVLRRQTNADDNQSAT